MAYSRGNQATDKQQNCKKYLFIPTLQLRLMFKTNLKAVQFKIEINSTLYSINHMLNRCKAKMTKHCFSDLFFFRVENIYTFMHLILRNARSIR